MYFYWYSLFINNHVRTQYVISTKTKNTITHGQDLAARWGGNKKARERANLPTAPLSTIKAVITAPTALTFEGKLPQWSRYGGSGLGGRVI